MDFHSQTTIEIIESKLFLFLDDSWQLGQLLAFSKAIPDVCALRTWASPYSMAMKTNNRVPGSRNPWGVLVLHQGSGRPFPLPLASRA